MFNFFFAKLYDELNEVLANERVQYQNVKQALGCRSFHPSTGRAPFAPTVVSSRGRSRPRRREPSIFPARFSTEGQRDCRRCRWGKLRARFLFSWPRERRRHHRCLGRNGPRICSPIKKQRGLWKALISGRSSLWRHALCRCRNGVNTVYLQFIAAAHGASVVPIYFHLFLCPYITLYIYSPCW